MKGKRVVVTIDDYAPKLREEAAMRNITLSNLVRTIIGDYLGQDQLSYNELFLRRLDTHSYNLGKLSRDAVITAETLAAFIQYQLSITPPLPVSDQDAVKAFGRERYEQFISNVAKRLTSGNRLTKGVEKNFSPEEKDLFTIILEDKDDFS